MALEQWYVSSRSFHICRCFIGLRLHSPRCREKNSVETSSEGRGRVLSYMYIRALRYAGTKRVYLVYWYSVVPGGSYIPGIIYIYIYIYIPVCMYLGIPYYKQQYISGVCLVCVFEGPLKRYVFFFVLRCLTACRIFLCRPVCNRSRSIKVVIRGTYETVVRLLL